MDLAELRPLTLGELLDRTFTLYRRHFWLFVGIMAIPSAFSVPFNLEFLSTKSMSTLGTRPSPSIITTAVLVGLGFLLLFWVVYTIAIGATTFAVSDTYLGRQTTIRDAYGKVRHRFWRIIGVCLNVLIRMFGLLFLELVGVGIIVGLATVASRGEVSQTNRSAVATTIAIVVVVAYLCALASIFFWGLRYSVAISALLLENIGVFAAIRRSVQLTKGHRWQIFVAVLLGMLIAYTGIIIFQGPLMVAMVLSLPGGNLPSWLLFLFSVLGAVGGAVTMPVLMIVLVLCYYDTRIRKEAFDLQFMMSSLDQAAPAPGTVSPV